MVDRLADDHTRARRLAAGLAKLPGVCIDLDTPHTNMVFLSLQENIRFDAAQVARLLEEREVRVGVTGARRFRLVTHYWIDDAGVEQAIQAFDTGLQEAMI